jgi:hypothetical protein
MSESYLFSGQKIHMQHLFDWIDIFFQLLAVGSMVTEVFTADVKKAASIS